MRTRGVASVILGVGVALSVFVPTRARAQCEQAKLTASDAVEEGYFGASVAICGDVAVIGAVGNGEAGNQSGAAYVFRRIGSTWVQKQKLIPSDPGESARFGSAVAVDGTTIMVASHNSGFCYGAVYVFEWEGPLWVQRQKLVAPDPHPGGHFGWSVAIDGDVAAVGQYADEFCDADAAGAVCVFRRTGSFWVLEEKLIPDDSVPQGYDHFGFSVSLKGPVLVGGAPTLEGGGAAYVFRWNGSSWVQEQKITGSDGTSGDGFGRSVATYDNVLVAGAPSYIGAYVGSGLAYAYRFNGLTWSDEQKLNPPTEVQYRSFGKGLSVLGDRLLVGATGAGAPGPASGAVYLYTLKNGQWVEVRELVPTDPIPVQGFGSSVSLGLDRAVVGAYGDDDACPQDPFCGSGSAYIFDLNLCVTGIPAVSTWGLVVLALSVLVVGVLLLRKRGTFAERELARKYPRQSP